VGHAEGLGDRVRTIRAAGDFQDETAVLAADRVVAVVR